MTLTGRVSEIKNKYSFKFSDDNLSKAFNNAKVEINKNAYNDESFNTNSTAKFFKLKQFIADVDFNDEVNEDDLILTLYQKEYPFDSYNVDTSYVDSFKGNHPNGCSYLFMKDTFTIPSTYTFLIEYKSMISSFEELKLQRKLLEEWYCISYLQDAVDANTFQQGISSMEIDGQSINYDQAGMEAFRLYVNEQISLIILNISGLNATSINFSKDYSNKKRDRFGY